jgi:hypothetical protein
MDPTSSLAAVPDESDLDADIIPEQVYHDAALTFLNAQISASDGLDGKASQALTVGSAALPLTIALVSVARASGADAPVVSLEGAPRVLFVLALIFYLAILLLNLRLGLISAIEFKPEMHDLRRNYLAQRRQPLAGRGLRGWITDAYIDSSEENRSLLVRKAKLVFYVQLALSLEGASLAIGAAWALLS